jgi:hypothetical protein
VNCFRKKMFNFNSPIMNLRKKFPSYTQSL